MPIVVLGLSHKTAPAEVRNRHIFPAERVTEALSALREYPGVRESAILATCNRLEIYADVSDFEVGAGQLKDFLTAYRHADVSDLEQYLYTLLGAAAVEQLFRVVSGLDSMLIGEAEVVAQVKQALGAAEKAGSLGPNLHRLFRMALETGKQARTKTRIGRNVVSLGAAAVGLASRHCDLRRTRVLVIGAGRMGTTVAKHLRARGAPSITVANRTLSRAAALAAEVGGRAVRLNEIPEILAATDVVISAVGRGQVIVTEAMLRAALARHAARRLLIVDFGVPRDVEQPTAPIEGLALYELADLRQIVDESLDERRAEIPAVEAILTDQVREYVRWYQSRAAAPLIAGLRRKAEEIRAREIARLFARLPELDEAQRRNIDAASASIINQLLHAPVTRLRQTVADGQDGAQPERLQELVDLAGLSEQLERQLSAAMRPPPR